MNSPIFRVAFALLLIFELGWFLYPRESSLGRDDYRLNERSKAYLAYSADPSTNNWNKVHEELELAAKHDDNKHVAIFCVLLALDIPLAVFISRFNRSNRQQATNRR